MNQQKLGVVIDKIENHIEDSILTNEESKLIENSIEKIKSGNKSDFSIFKF